MFLSPFLSLFSISLAFIGQFFQRLCHFFNIFVFDAFFDVFVAFLDAFKVVPFGLLPLFTVFVTFFNVFVAFSHSHPIFYLIVL